MVSPVRVLIELVIGAAAETVSIFRIVSTSERVRLERRNWLEAVSSSTTLVTVSL